MKCAVATGDLDARYRGSNRPDDRRAHRGEHFPVDKPVVRPIFPVPDVVANLLGFVPEVHVMPSAVQ
jgi:hypothetical protein